VSGEHPRRGAPRPRVQLLVLSFVAAAAGRGAHAATAFHAPSRPRPPGPSAAAAAAAHAAPLLRPYDTLEEVIGLRGTPGHGSLAEWGVTYRELPLAPGGGIDWEALAKAVVPGKTKVAHVQRSCGYALRPTLSIGEIERIVKVVKAQVRKGEGGGRRGARGARGRRRPPRRSTGVGGAPLSPRRQGPAAAAAGPPLCQPQPRPGPARAPLRVRAQDPNCVVVVDNCYGEFTEGREPPAAGADLAMGSLIKNGGGTLAPGGGYVAGRADLIGAVAARLAAPGIGVDAGGVGGETLRALFQGLFMGAQVRAGRGLLRGAPRGRGEAPQGAEGRRPRGPRRWGRSGRPPRQQRPRRSGGRGPCAAGAVSLPLTPRCPWPLPFLGTPPPLCPPPAPQTTGEALKGGRLVAQVMAAEGFPVIPVPGMAHTPSMITAVELGSRERMEAFCRGIQRRCPVGSYIRPVPGARSGLCGRGRGAARGGCLRGGHEAAPTPLPAPQPLDGARPRPPAPPHPPHPPTPLPPAPPPGVTAGYGDEVIFADGTFVDGSTAELSADGPLRPPYVVYCQGGTHWTHWAISLESAVEELRAQLAAESN
jgi:cystathionine beta-lyase family protein involved in aluminum resistance